MILQHLGFEWIVRAWAAVIENKAGPAPTRARWGTYLSRGVRLAYNKVRRSGASCELGACLLGVSGTGNVRGGGTCRDNDPFCGNHTACSRSRG